MTCASSAAGRAQERSARRREDEAPDLGAIVPVQRLEDRVVLAVDRQQTRRRASRAARVTSSPATTRTSLLASATCLPASIGRERRLETERADQRRDHEVGLGMGRDRERPFGSDEDAAGVTRHARAQLGGARLVGDRHQLGRVAPHLLREDRRRCVPPPSDTARKRSGKRSTSASVDTPTEPVEPRSAKERRRGVSLMRGVAVAGPAGRLARTVRFGARAKEAERHQRKVVPVHVVAQIEMPRKPGAGEVQLVPGAVVPAGRGRGGRCRAPTRG